MRLLLLCLAMVTSSGCVLSRSLVLPSSSVALDDPQVSAQWSVGEVFVRTHERGPPMQEPRDFAPLRAQLEARLRRTLEAQGRLGYRADDAPYALEVVVDVRERSVASPWLVLGASLETGTLLGAAALGTAAGGIAGGPIGMLLGAPLAVVAAMIPPTTTESGEFEATVVVRRRSDGAVLASRHVRSDWHLDVNGFRREGKLAHESGAAIPELEQGVLEIVRQVMREESRAHLAARTG